MERQRDVGLTGRRSREIWNWHRLWVDWGQKVIKIHISRQAEALMGVSSALGVGLTGQPVTVGDSSALGVGLTGRRSREIWN